jgi:hypothetical protein
MNWTRRKKNISAGCLLLGSIWIPFMWLDIVQYSGWTVVPVIMTGIACFIGSLIWFGINNGCDF